MCGRLVHSCRDDTVVMYCTYFTRVQRKETKTKIQFQPQIIKPRLLCTSRPFLTLKCYGIIIFFLIEQQEIIGGLARIAKKNLQKPHIWCELILPWCSAWAHSAPKTHRNIHYGSGCVPYKTTITGSSPCSHVQLIQLIICPPTAAHTAPFQRFAVHLISVLFLIPMPLDQMKDIKKIIKSFNHSFDCIPCVFVLFFFFILQAPH